MTVRAILIGVLVANLFSSGCGTIMNFASSVVSPNDGVRAYGGVALDLKYASDFAKDKTGGNSIGSGGGSSGAGYAAAALLIVFGPLLDLPLSFMGDTLTYPLARYLDSDIAH